MNIFESTLIHHASSNIVKAARENAGKQTDLNIKIAYAWQTLIFVGVSGQCCLLGASWLAAEVGNWVKRDEFKVQYNAAKCKSILGEHESWILPIIETWMK